MNSEIEVIYGFIPFDNNYDNDNENNADFVDKSKKKQHHNFQKEKKNNNKVNNKNNKRTK